MTSGDAKANGRGIGRIKHIFSAVSPCSVVSLAGGFELRNSATGGLIRAISVDSDIIAIRFSASGVNVACRTPNGFAGEWLIATGYGVTQSGEADVLWPKTVAIVNSVSPEQRNWSHEVLAPRAVVWTHERIVVWKLREPGAVFTERQCLHVLSATLQDTHGSSAMPAMATRQHPSPETGEQTIVPSRNDHRRLIDAPLRIYHLESCDVMPLQPAIALCAAAFSATGKWLAVCNRVGICLFDLRCGRLPHTQCKRIICGSKRVWRLWRPLSRSSWSGCGKTRAPPHAHDG